MSQIFHHSTNTFSRLSIFGGIFILSFLVWAWAELNESTYATRAKTPVDQPVPFSHEHHVGGLGIDCRYCHTSVETSSFANIPPTKTCMNCHSQIWNRAPMLEPVRESFRSDTSIRWIRVHDLPDYVYFRPKSEVFSVNWQPPPNQVEMGRELVKEYNVQSLTSCSTCHR